MDLMGKCKNFKRCNAPICPLDKQGNLRIKYSEDEVCPYCRIYKKHGKRLKMPKELRALVPKENVKFLSPKNRA